MKRLMLRAFARALDSIGSVGRILAGQPYGPGVTLFGYWRMKLNPESVRQTTRTPGESTPSAAPIRTLRHDASSGRGR